MLFAFSSFYLDLLSKLDIVFLAMSSSFKFLLSYDSFDFITYEMERISSFNFCISMFFDEDNANFSSYSLFICSYNDFLVEFSEFSATFKYPAILVTSLSLYSLNCLK